MDCHTVHVYVGCGGGFVYSEHALSYLLESYTVLLSCGFLNLFEVFYLAYANQLFPSDYCYTVEKYMKAVGMQCLGPAKTLPPLPPAPCNRSQVKCVLQSWRELTTGR